MIKVEVARLATRLWEGQEVGWRMFRMLLLPTAALYAGAAAVRNAGYGSGLLRALSVTARTVSVGNLRVGGTGKTPFTRWLAGELRERGVTVAIVSRGYGGRGGGARIVGDGNVLYSDVGECGDEAVMLARTAGVPVVVGRDRVAAAALAVERFGSRLVLCDDAFQHRRLRRDLDIVLVDAGETGGVARQLPAGPLREPLAALRRAQVVVLCERGDVSGDVPVQAAGRLVVRASLAPAALVRPAAAGWEEVGLGLLAGRKVLAVSGVARPASLYASLRAWEAELVNVLEYPDHHPYDVVAWKQISAAAKDADLVVTTEKDLVKLDRFPFERDKLVALRLAVTVDRAEILLEQVIGAREGVSG